MTRAPKCLRGSRKSPLEDAFERFTPDWVGGLSPESAARVKAMALSLRPHYPLDEFDKRIDALLEADPVHQWFCYCLDALARRAE